MDTTTHGGRDSQTRPAADLNHTFIDPQDKFWFLYLSDAEKYDRLRMESWKGDTDGILIFTGLFAATVATFTVSSYNMLSPDPNEQTATLLMTLVSLNLNGSQAAIVHQQPAFRASTPAVCINAFWIVSLFLALACALAATLVQQWARRYAHHVQRRGPPRIRGPIHVVLSMGLRRFGMNQAVASIIGTLHVSVGLFMAGLGIYMSTANDTIAYLIAGVMGIGILSYGFVTVLPLACTDSPYKTPLTPFLQLCITLACVMLAVSGSMAARLIGLARLFVASPGLKRQRQWLEDRVDATLSWAATLRGKRIKFARDLVEKPTVSRETFAIRQTLRDIDEIHELETFCDALLAVVQPAKGTRWDMGPRERAEVILYLLKDLNIMDRIGELVNSLFFLSGLEAREVHSRRLTVGLRLCRALTMVINFEDHTGTFCETVLDALLPLLRIWASTITAGEIHSDITFIARFFLSAIRANVYRHHLSTTTGFMQARSYRLAAVLTRVGERVPPNESFGSMLPTSQMQSDNDNWDLIHAFMCYDYVHLIRDNLISISTGDIHTLDAHAQTWLPLLRDTHATLCESIENMRRPCLDMLESLLKEVKICHRQPTGVLLIPPGASNRAGKEDSEDPNHIIFSHHPELADMLHHLWMRMKRLRPDIGFCTHCYLFQQRTD